jgi:hypothetical protein
MDDFRSSQVKAIRHDDGTDWSIHSVDYVLLEHLLIDFAHRRAQLRELLRNSSDACISHDVLANCVEMASKPAESHNNGGLADLSSRHSPGSCEQQETTTQPALSNYIPLVESSSTLDGVSRDAPDDWGTRLNHRAVFRRISSAERDELCLFLTSEMDKVAQLYVKQFHSLSEQVESTNSGAESLAVLGTEILELYAFCAVNVVTVYQILIRYDAFARTYGGSPIFHFYMKMDKKRSHQESFRKVLFHEELNALADTYCLEITDPMELDSFNKQKIWFSGLMDSTYRAKSLGSTGNIRDSFIIVLRDYFLLGAIEDRLGLSPNLLTLQGANLTLEMNQLAEWRRKPKSWQPQKPATATLTPPQLFALSLNLLSAFLYCVNYYVVEPSSTKYVNALGAEDAMSGTLIGMMPLGAFTSAIPFSIWTNRAFRPPFLVSAALLIVGNLLYAKALNYNRLEIALLGRFMAGLGAPKCIVRRYMADTTPLSLRTSANAGFGMAVAVGSALGPATAIMLSQLNNHPWSGNVPLFGGVILNGLTGPGYFMALLWTLFFLVLVATFGEPDRRGLEEQKHREALATASHLPASQNDVALLHPSDVNLARSLRAQEGDGILRDESQTGDAIVRAKSWIAEVRGFLGLITLPVRICLGLLFAKVFTIEALVSCTSALTKNRYGWTIDKVGTLGCVNGLMVIPLSIGIGGLSMRFQDRVLMTMLVTLGCIGMFLLIDVSDLIATPTDTYNKGNPLAVSPARYVSGYFLTYVSIQCFEGVIGSTLSKVIPTALATGTFNSGLLATLVDTFGRACGDLFISMVGFINIRELMDLLFIPCFLILSGCLYVIRFQFYDILAV